MVMFRASSCPQLSGLPSQVPIRAAQGVCSWYPWGEVRFISVALSGMLRETLAEGLHLAPSDRLLRPSTSCCAEWEAPMTGQWVLQMQQREENKFILKILGFSYCNFCS